MTPSCMIAVTTAVLCLTLGLLSPAPAAGARAGRACCTKYARKPVPFQRIKGYREQSAKEYCRIDAIIFYTVKETAVCATRKDEWVRKTLELLSSKLKKLSKPASSSDQTAKERSGTFSAAAAGGSGSSLGTTETFLYSTGSFY
ncbi:C-C motif chemokine 19-like [Aulostomus maculatus]